MKQQLPQQHAPPQAELSRSHIMASRLNCCAGPSRGLCRNWRVDMSDQTITRIEGRLKVTGSAVFAAETPAERMLHAALVEASIASGKVIDVDVSAARR